MSPVFSIIIPVYNVAPYLRECLDSVLAQTFTDWEAICVDDGSIDGSDAILDEFAAQDKRFRVFHQKNQGVGNARNVALENVLGTWLMFLDADDIYHRNTLLSCFQAIKCHPESEIVKFTFTKFIDGCRCEWGQQEECDVCKLASFRDVVSVESYSGAFCGGAYLFDPIKHIRFKSFPIGEDRLWLAEVIDKISEGVELNLPLYGYRQRQGSAMQQKWDARKFKSEIGWRLEVLRIWERSDKKVSRVMLRESALTMTEYMSDVYFSMCHEARKEVFDYWAFAMKEYSHFKDMPAYFQLLMRINSLLKLQCFIWLSCWLPYFLKRHGIHR